MDAVHDNRDGGMMAIHTMTTASITYTHSSVSYMLSPTSNPPIKNVKMHRAESKGADISFRIVDADTGWDVGTKCPVPGDRISLTVNSSTLFYGFVSEVTPSDEGYFTISAVDIITLMAKMGRSVQRNIYNSSRVEVNSAGTYDGSSAIYATLPSSEYRVTDIGDVTFNANNTEVISGSETVNRAENTSGAYIEFNYASHGLSFFRAFKDTIFAGQVETIHAGSASVIVDGVTYKTVTWDTMDLTSSYAFTIDMQSSPIYVKDKIIKIRIYSDSYQLYPNNVRYALDGTRADYVYNSDTSQTVYNARASADWYGFKEKTVTAGYQTGAEYYLTEITDVTIGQDALDTDFDGNLSSYAFPYRIVIFTTFGTVGVIASMQAVLDSVGIGYSFGTVPTMQDVAEFRMAGGNILDYIWTLMDMKASSATQGMSMYSSGYLTLAFGTRLNKSNTAEYAIVSGKDIGASSLTELKIVSSDPNMSMVNRYPTYIAKGTENESTADGSTSNPLIVAVYDAESLSQIGVALEGVSSDSSNSTASACASDALSDVLSGRASEWSGSFVVSGIHHDMISRSASTIGSGVPVRLYHSRLGLSNYQAKVREMTLDFDAQTTTLVLNNYSQKYVNQVTDASSMSVMAATYANNSATETSFTTQFALVRSSFSHLSSGNTMTLQLTNGQTAQVDAQVFVFPETGTKTIVARWGADSIYDNSNPHAAYKVKINSGSYITIPSAIRPDKKRGQVLIINVVATI